MVEALIPATSVTHSTEETFEMGRRLGERLRPHAVILLTGDLGSGKTIFTKGIAAGLGIDPGEITSPSFTLINSHEGRSRLYHVDLYRLAAGAWRNLGLEEILEEENAVVVVEWADRLGFIPPGALSVKFEYVSDTDRRIQSAITE